MGGVQDHSPGAHRSRCAEGTVEDRSAPSSHPQPDEPKHPVEREPWRDLVEVHGVGHGEGLVERKIEGLERNTPGLTEKEILALKKR